MRMITLVLIKIMTLMRWITTALTVILIDVVKKKNKKRERKKNGGEDIYDNNIITMDRIHINENTRRNVMIIMMI